MPAFPNSTFCRPKIMWTIFMYFWMVSTFFICRWPLFLWFWRNFFYLFCKSNFLVLYYSFAWIFLLFSSLILEVGSLITWLPLFHLFQSNVHLLILWFFPCLMESLRWFLVLYLSIDSLLINAWKKSAHTTL